MRAYGLVADEQMQPYPTTAGILLFGKEPQQFFSEAFIICSNFAGITGREVISTRDCAGPLSEQFGEAYNFTISRLNRSFSIKGIMRDEKLEIPAEAFREVLINAIVHRNYHILSPIKIAIYENRIEIFSPEVFGTFDFSNSYYGIYYLRNTAMPKFLKNKVYGKIGYRI